MVLLLFVVARMEKEMEGMMEELVAETVVEMEGRVAGQGGRHGSWVLPLICCWLEMEKEERKK